MKEGYVYDQKLNYGFNYPAEWNLFINIDKDLEQCDPELNYEDYNCVEFPDRTMKKNIVFQKEIPKDDYFVSVDISFSAKTSSDIQAIKKETKNEAVLAGLEISKDEEISVNNVDGYDIVAGTPGWKMRQTIFFSNGMVYIFKYSSQEEFYLMYEEIFDDIVNSFSIK